MKPKYFFALILLIVAGCKKGTSILPSLGLQGTWELESSYGSWGGYHEYPQGNGNTFTFNGNNYSRTTKTTDTTYQGTGTFRIYTAKPCDFADEQPLIEFDNNNFTESFSLSNGKLIIGTTECIIDGGYSTYRKIQ